MNKITKSNFLKISFLALAAVFYFASCRYLSHKFDSGDEIIRKKASANPIISLSLSMSKELRQVAASYLWLRVDEYFHSAAVRMSENREIIPLIKLVTIFDHSFIEAYLVLAHHLAYHLDKKDMAIEVLNEGIENNLNPPASRLSELYFEAGWINATLLKDTKEAILSLAAGKKYLSDDCDIDNASLALRLLNYLKNSQKDIFDMDTYRKTISDKDIYAKLESLGREAEEQHDGEDGHATDIEGPADEHRYAGQNPWQNPFLSARLTKAAYVYAFMLACFLLSRAIASYVLPRR
ncbi:MAG TPA: hypothetical protein PK467_01630 [Candidatus Wallbacteria bacterium]|nr:hypothetical protein [Candidatus Wallbacteria bacterium]